MAEGIRLVSGFKKTAKNIIERLSMAGLLFVSSGTTSNQVTPSKPSKLQSPSDLERDYSECELCGRRGVPLRWIGLKNEVDYRMQVCARDQFLMGYIRRVQNSMRSVGWGEQLQDEIYNLLAFTAKHLPDHPSESELPIMIDFADQ